MSARPSSLTQRVAVVAGGRAATTASVLVVNAILTRAWPGAVFGLFGAVWVLGNTLIPIFLLGLPTALLYFYPRCRAAGRRGLVGRAAACLAASGLVAVALLWLAGPALARSLGLEAAAGSPGLQAALTAFLPYVLAAVAAGYVDAVLVAAGRAGRQAGLSLLTAAGVVAAALWGAKAGWSAPQVLGALSAVGVGRLVLGTILTAAAVRAVRAERGGEDGELAAGLREVLGYAWAIGLNDAAGSLSRSVDRLVVLGLFVGQTFGLYHAGAIEVPVSLLLSAAVAVLVPEISRLHRDGRLAEVASLWRGAVSRLALVVLPLFAFLFWFAGPLMALYLPDAYGASRWVFAIYILALPVRCAVYAPLLIGMGRARWALWGSLGDLGANLILSLSLARGLLALDSEWAFLGPAAATVLATYGQVAALLVLIGRDLSLSVAQLLPWRSLGQRGLVCVAAAALARGISLAVDPPALQLGLGLAAYAVLAALYLRSNGAARREVTEVMGAALSKRNSPTC